MCPVRAAVPVNALAMTFPPDPVWVRSAREAVRTAMNTVVGAKQDLIETAMLLTSEVVTNAVAAAGNSLTPGPIGLRAGWTPDGAIHVLVRDQGPGDPAEPDDPLQDGDESEDEECGRGLMLVTHEATDWGVCQHGREEGKSVWFSLS
ncbi:ATP-binding protein [Streptomyces sp. NPDC048172]|uniref:ATP-binding protein n=1 Tax=Streptomyces sp. NPDC048172 TaxID=3365505 RepID=UPI00371345F5